MCLNTLFYHSIDIDIYLFGNHNSPCPSRRAVGTVVARLARRAADATPHATVALSASTRTGRSTITFAARACLGVVVCHLGHHLPPPPRPVHPPHIRRTPLQDPFPWLGKPAAVAVLRKRAPAVFLAQPLQQHPPWWIPHPADWWTPKPNPAQPRLLLLQHPSSKTSWGTSTILSPPLNYSNLAFTSTLSSCFLNLQKTPSKLRFFHKRVYCAKLNMSRVYNTGFHQESQGNTYSYTSFRHGLSNLHPLSEMCSVRTGVAPYFEHVLTQVGQVVGWTGRRHKSTLPLRKLPPQSYFLTTWRIAFHFFGFN